MARVPRGDRRAYAASPRAGWMRRACLLLATVLAPVVVSGCTAQAGEVAASSSVVGRTSIGQGESLSGVYSSGTNAGDAQLLHDLQPDILGWFEQWGSASTQGNSKLASACRAGVTPLITWESWSGSTGSAQFDLAKIAEGAFDSYILDFRDRIRDACGQVPLVLVRFDHEMDMQKGYTRWYPWQGYPTEYVAAWRHVADILRSGDVNVKLVWSPNRYTSLTRQYYPGDAYVDYVGITLNTSESSNRPYSSFSAFYEANSAIESYGKGIIVAEAAVDLTPFSTKQRWISDAFALLESNPAIKALVWLNTADGADGADYRVDSDAPTYALFEREFSALRASR